MLGFADGGAELGKGFAEFGDGVVGVQSAGVGEDPDAGGAGGGVGLLADGCVGIGEGGAVGADAEERDPGGAVFVDLADEARDAGEEFGAGQDVGGRGGAGDEVGDAVAHGEEVFGVIGGE